MVTGRADRGPGRAGPGRAGPEPPGPRAQTGPNVPKIFLFISALCNKNFKLLLSFYKFY